MPGKPRGEAPLKGAQRQARYRLKKALEAQQQQKLGADALSFVLGLAEPETYSMTWESKRTLRDLVTRARLEAAHSD